MIRVDQIQQRTKIERLTAMAAAWHQQAAVHFKSMQKTTSLAPGRVADGSTDCLRVCLRYEAPRMSQYPGAVQAMHMAS